jgi:hypothetical protein
LQEVILLSDGPTGWQPEKPRQRWLRLNFVLSFWLLIAWCVYAVMSFARVPVEVWQRWSPYSGRIIMFPIAIAAVQLLLWFKLYRRFGRPARWAAGLIGVYFFIQVLIQLLRASIQVEISVPHTWFFFYVGASHVLYALGGSRFEP